LYHYNVKSANSDGDNAESGDITFVSSKAATTSTTTVTETTTTTVTKILEDTEKPLVSFTTKFDKPFSKTPEIAGKVTDNVGVASIEYSIDGGANYLPVDEISGLRSKSVVYSFQLLGLLDGNFKLKVRATDLSGNTAVSEEKTLVYDRLPPRVGGSIFSLGSQILQPDKNGDITALVGVNQKVTLSAVGGPTEIKINAKCEITNAKCEQGKVFNLSKNIDTGLWSGEVYFAEPGYYQLASSSIDGAGNKVEANFATVKVLPKGKVLFDDKPLINATLKVFYFEPMTGQFTFWDAVAYGQNNPLITDDKGSYSLTLPPGKYYFQLDSGKLKARSKIFTLDSITPVNARLNLGEQKQFSLGPLSFTLPEIFQPQIQVDFTLGRQVSKEFGLTGKELPDFSFEKDGETYDNFFFRGKPMVFTLLNTWLPSASQQISVLDSVSEEVKANLVVVVPQENSTKVDIFQNLGGYKLFMFSDADGEYMSKLKTNSLPATIFVDRKGIVTGSYFGILNKDLIFEKLFE
jgi:Thiol-disulfide isomerase and thioredoxins